MSANAFPDVFDAVADPTRRRILDLLNEGERAVMDIVRAFTISQPSISEHLRILRNAGLVHVRRLGRSRIYSLDATPIRQLSEWVAAYERFWGGKLTSLRDYLDRQTPTPLAGDAERKHSQMPMEFD